MRLRKNTLSENIFFLILSCKCRIAKKKNCWEWTNWYNLWQF